MGDVTQPRHRVQSPVPAKPHIWRQPLKPIFGQAEPPWVCANLAQSVVKFGARGETPKSAYAAWRDQNRGTGRYG
jgi:hypothetical protein